jgi:bacterioferritin (cytochrome b1)
MGEDINRAEVVRDLNKALPLQYRSALAFAVAAGTLTGADGVALSGLLRGWAADELLDVERVAGRISVLGGEPVRTVGSLEAPKTTKASLKALASLQQEAIDAFAAAIPAGADDSEGEATEHLLEHVINRKRDVLEKLERALR